MKEVIKKELFEAQSVLEKAHLLGYRDEVFEHLRHNLDLKQQQCETLIKLNHSDDGKASFDQATMGICVRIVKVIRLT